MAEQIDRLERIVETLAESHQKFAMKMSEFTGAVQAGLENNKAYISAVDRKLDAHMKEGKKDTWNVIMAAIAMFGGLGAFGMEALRHIH